MEQQTNHTQREGMIMTYFKAYKEKRADIIEITKDEAKDILTGWWKDDFIERIFNDEVSFRLYTPYLEVWTKTEDGLVPMAGFYGAIE